MRKSTSLTIEEEHIAALDAERDKYTSRSDLINQILDKYNAEKINDAGITTKTNLFSVEYANWEYGGIVDEYVTVEYDIDVEDFKFCEKSFLDSRLGIHDEIEAKTFIQFVKDCTKFIEEFRVESELKMPTSDHETDEEIVVKMVNSKDIESLVLQHHVDKTYIIELFIRDSYELYNHMKKRGCQICTVDEINRFYMLLNSFISGKLIMNTSYFLRLERENRESKEYLKYPKAGG